MLRRSGPLGEFHFAPFVDECCGVHARKYIELNVALQAARDYQLKTMRSGWGVPIFRWPLASPASGVDRTAA
jgi:hypothetical protein